jgi:hypothetical protein
MSTRINPFANLAEVPAFTTKPKKETQVEKESMERIAAENNFPSRQAPKPKAERRKPRIYRTGRNQQFNAKATPETIQRFYKLADEKRVPLGELLKQGLDALEATDSLQKLADKKDISLQELVTQALDALDRAGARVSVPLRRQSSSERMAPDPHDTLAFPDQLVAKRAALLFDRLYVHAEDPLLLYSRA